MNESQWQSLYEQACSVRERAYAPYSQFRVGAALLTQRGGVYLGCNIENAAYSPSLCAERGAIAAAVAAGDRELAAICIVADKLASPCGVCRQVLYQFGTQIRVRSYAADDPQKFQEWSSSELLPDGFELNPHG